MLARTLSVCCLAMLIPLLLGAQVHSSSVRGTVRLGGSQARSLRLRLVLREVSSGAPIATTTADSNGNFAFHGVPFGSYNLEVIEGRSVPIVARIAVRSAIPVWIELDTLRSYTAQPIAVESPPWQEPSSSGQTTTHWFFSEEDRTLLPTPMGQRAIEAVLMNTPGVVPDEDGRLHIRGESAQLHYVLDGIPITGNMTRVYSSLFNAATARSIDVLTGGIGAEYNADGIVTITTKSGLGQPLSIHGAASVGSYASREAMVEALGQLGSNVGLYLGGTAMRTDRFLDPISSGPITHDDATAQSILAKLTIAPNQRLEITALGMVNATRYAIPNQHPTSTQDQRHQLDDDMLGLRATAQLDTAAVASVALYTRRAHAELTSSGLVTLDSTQYARAIMDNEKFFIGSRRQYRTYGVQAQYTQTASLAGAVHTLSAGINGDVTPTSEYLSFAVTNPAVSTSDSTGGDSRFAPYDLTRGGHPFVVDQTATLGRVGAFVSDAVTWERWTLRIGLRADYYRFRATEWALSPRLGVSYALADNLSLRASYGHLFLPPPLENYLVSSSDQARQFAGSIQGDIPSVVRAERGHAFELGATYRPSAAVEVDVCGYAKLLRNFLVEVELSNSGIIFPANLKEGIVAGGEIRLRLHEWHGLSGFAWIGTSVSRGLIPTDGSSPFAAGLVVGEEGATYANPFRGEDSFPTEHDQLLTAAFTLRYAVTPDLTAVLSGRFDSGLPFDLTGPNGQPLLTAEQSRAELQRRGYHDDVIDLLDLEPEMPGSPDRRVKPHATFDAMLRYDLQSVLRVPLSVGLTVINIFDTPYLYKFESTFGSTHLGMRRSVRLDCSLRLPS